MFREKDRNREKSLSIFRSFYFDTSKILFSSFSISTHQIFFSSSFGESSVSATFYFIDCLHFSPHPLHDFNGTFPSVRSDPPSPSILVDFCFPISLSLSFLRLYSRQDGIDILIQTSRSNGACN